MGAHQRECFHEVLHNDDKMTVTFQVGDREFGGAGNLEIDFWVGDYLSRVWGSSWQRLRGISKLHPYLLGRLYAYVFRVLLERCC